MEILMCVFYAISSGRARYITQPILRLFCHICIPFIQSSAVLPVQRPRKRYGCFAKQQPGRARQKFLATTYKAFPGTLYSLPCFPSTLQRLTVWAAEVKILSNFIGTLPEDSPLKANCDIYFPTSPPTSRPSPNLFPGEDFFVSALSLFKRACKLQRCIL